MVLFEFQEKKILYGIGIAGKIPVIAYGIIGIADNCETS